MRRSRCAEGQVKSTLGLLLVLAMATVTAAAQGRTDTPDRRIEGHWVRTDPTGAGSFGGLADQVPPAQLTPAAAGARGGGPGRSGGPGPLGGPQPTRPNPAGVPYIVVERPCANPGRG